MRRRDHDDLHPGLRHLIEIARRFPVRRAERQLRPVVEEGERDVELRIVLAAVREIEDVVHPRIDASHRRGGRRALRVEVEVVVITRCVIGHRLEGYRLRVVAVVVNIEG